MSRKGIHIRMLCECFIYLQLDFVNVLYTKVMIMTYIHRVWMWNDNILIIKKNVKPQTSATENMERKS